MIVAFVLIAAALILAALAVVIVPLVRTAPRAALDAEQQGRVEHGERLAVLADDLRELDAELAAGTLAEREYAEAKTELQRQALAIQDGAGRPTAASSRASWAPALVIAVALPLLSVVLYVAMGQPTALITPNRSAASTSAAPHARDGGQMQAMTARLRQRLEDNGGDTQGWTLLARSYNAMQQPQDALDAYARAVQLDPDNADLLIEYANAVATMHDNSLQGRPRQLIEQALQAEPDNLNALALAGAAAFQRGDRDGALQYWRHLKRLIPQDSPEQARVDELLAQASGQQPPATPGKASINGTVTISEDLASQITAGDTLFIFARANGGSPMPLAVVREPAPRFPTRFTLDDSHAMTPELKLSGHDNVSIIARVSRTGSATPQAGDLQGRIDRVTLGSDHVHIVIDHQIKG